MTMISTPLPLRTAGGEDGQALQRRLLLDMERQWLDTWAQTDQLAADASSRTPDDGKPKEPNGSLGLDALSDVQPGLKDAPGTGQARPATPTPSGLRAEAASPSRWMAPSRATATAEAPTQGPPTPMREEQRGNKAEASSASATRVLGPRQATPAFSSAPAGAAAPEPHPSETAAARNTMVMGAMAHTASAPEHLPAPAAPLTSTEAPLAPKPAAPGLQGHAPRQGERAEDSSGESHASGAARAARTTASPSSASDTPTHELQRITLRELDSDTVQATLRDAQLNPQASVLAAQGLHHALMEAGYARVRVVVNGHAVRTKGAAGDSTVRDTPHAPTPLTPTARKA